MSWQMMLGVQRLTARYPSMQLKHHIFRVLLTLADYAGVESLEAWPCQARIVRDSSVEPRSVRRALVELVDMGLIAVASPAGRRHRSTTYRMLIQVEADHGKLIKVEAPHYVGPAAPSAAPAPEAEATPETNAPRRRKPRSGGGEPIFLDPPPLPSSPSLPNGGGGGLSVADRGAADATEGTLSPPKPSTNLLRTDYSSTRASGALKAAESPPPSVPPSAPWAPPPMRSAAPLYESPPKLSVGEAVERFADEFREFYRLYPRKKAPADARKAFAQQIARGVPPLKIIKGLEAQLPELSRVEDPKFVPFPATWLRAARWADVPDSTTRPSRLSTPL